MISLFAALCFLTAVETSDISEVQVQTVRSGDDVIIRCDLNSFKGKINDLIWFKQSFGKVPQSLKIKSRGVYVFRQEFNNTRFNIIKDLNITGTKEEDSGTVYCAEMLNNEVYFISGRILVVEADERKNREPLRLRCSEHSDGCEKISEAGSPEHNCSFTLLRRNLQSSHDGKYFCTGAAREEIRNRNGATQENNLYVKALVRGGDSPSCLPSHRHGHLYPLNPRLEALWWLASVLDGC
ncbi:uncharacterized protein LOC134320262 [Trichomycterus rosablanca]|uniref:uncharacterized protein LOC134320262 n=1 Tax=Trichomycterus rosablanca TaxID=2290929 RepID=UPI002F35540E